MHLNMGSVGPLDANQCAQPDLLPTFTRRVASVGASCKALNVGHGKSVYGRASCSSQHNKCDAVRNTWDERVFPMKRGMFMQRKHAHMIRHDFYVRMSEPHLLYSMDATAEEQFLQDSSPQFFSRGKGP